MVVKSSQDRQVAFYIISWLLGGLFTVLKGVWIGSGAAQFLDVNFLVILSAYLFLVYGSTASCGFAVGQGVLIDIFSGGLNGLFTAVYFGVFVAIYVTSMFFNLQDVRSRIIIVSFSVFIKNIFIILMLMLFSQHVIFSTAYLLVSGISVVISGLIAPLVFKLCDQLRSILQPEDRYSSSEAL
ncbi:MAG: hypothetical protein R6U38_16320 [Desulfatiglandaceae bacterium]